MGTKKVEIELVTNGGKLEWEISHKWKTGGPGDYPVIKFDKNDGPDLIVFKIKNPEPHIKFAESDAIWVQAGSKPQQSGLGNQIANPKTMENGKKLVVVDWNDNPTPVDLHYRLNFESPVQSLDPIIRNGGEGGPGLPMYDWAYVVGGLFLVGVVTLLVSRRFAKRRKQQP